MNMRLKNLRLDCYKQYCWRRRITTTTTTTTRTRTRTRTRMRTGTRTRTRMRTGTRTRTTDTTTDRQQQQQQQQIQTVAASARCLVRWGATAHLLQHRKERHGLGDERQTTCERQCAHLCSLRPAARSSWSSICFEGSERVG